MSQHKKLRLLIQQATLNYLRQAGTAGKLLSVFTQTFEKIIIQTTLEYYEGNYAKTAKALGISRTTLYKKANNN